MAPANAGEVPAFLGGTCLLETSRGSIGVELELIRREAVVLPWRDGRWLSPADQIECEPTRVGLASALAKAGLPEAEASRLAADVIAESDAKVAAARESGQRLRLELALDALRTLALPFGLLWMIGAGYLVRRAWRALA